MASSKETKDSNISKFPAKPVEKKTNRHKGLYIFSVIVLVIIVVTFIGGPLIGGLSSRGGSGKLVFGYYRNMPIAYEAGNYFSRQLMALERQFAEQNIQQQDMRIQVFQIWRTAFDRTLLHMALVYHAQKGGIPVSEDMVNRAIARSPEFQENGRFDVRSYNELNAQQQYALKKFTRDSLLHELYLQDVMGYTLTSDQESEFFAKMAGPQRKIAWVSFEFKDFPEEKIKEYLANNLDIFKSVNASTITLSKDKYSMDDALAIHSQIINNTITFADAAREHSSDPYAEIGGNAGQILLHEILYEYPDSEALKAVFSLGAGDISEPVESNLAYVIYKLDSTPESADPNNQETIEQVYSYIDNFERGIIADYFQAAAQKLVDDASTGSLRRAASINSKEVFESDYFAINYGGMPYFPAPPRNDEMGGAAATSRSFFKAAFQTAIGSTAQPVVFQDRVIVLSPIDEKEADEERQTMLASFYPNFVQQLLGTSLETILLESEHIEDNFVETLFANVVDPRG